MTRYFAAVTFHDTGSQFQTPSSSQDCAQKWVEFSQVPPPQVFLEAGYSYGFWSWLSKNKCTGGPSSVLVKIDPSSTVFPLLTRTSYRIYQLVILRGSLHWKEPFQISNAANQQCQLLYNVKIQKHSLITSTYHQFRCF